MTIRQKWRQVMARHWHIFTIELQVQAPFITKSSGAKRFGCDSALWRYKGQPAIPGTLIKGNLRHCLRYFMDQFSEKDTVTSAESKLLESLKQVDVWFGRASDEGSFDPQRGDLIFDYAWLSQEKENKLEEAAQRFRHRIAINESKGIVEKGSIQVIEAPFAVGQSIAFSGQIRFKGNKAEIKNLYHWLSKTLDYLAAIGGLKAIGFGKVLADSKVTYEKVKINNTDEPRIEQFTSLLNAKENEWIPLALQFDRPFSLGAGVIPNTNRFRSLSYVPGNVLKGVIARHCFRHESEADKQELLFDDWGFRHAYAVRKADHQEKYNRHSVLPLSLAVVGKKVVDMAYLSAKQPLAKFFLLKDENNGWVAPCFQSDWKYSDKEAAIKSLNILSPELDNSLTLHTRIEQNLQSAEDEGLFSQEEVFAKNDSTVWVTEVKFPSGFNEAQKEKLIQHWQELDSMGLGGIGRTQAVVSIDAITSEAIKEEKEENQVDKELPESVEGKWFVTLVSDALILPTELKFQSSSMKATNDGAVLKNVYQEYFQSLHPDIELVTFFAEQYRVGGLYHHQYYQSKSKAKPSNYAPKWLTRSGSVFVLKSKSQESEHSINNVLQGCLKEGLAVHSEYKDNNWQENPYLPVHGYGEIIINHSIHERLRVDQEGQYLDNRAFLLAPEKKGVDINVE